MEFCEGKKYYVPDFLIKDAQDVTQMDAAEVIKEMKKMDEDQMKKAVVKRVTNSINVVDIIYSGCALFFDLLDKYLGVKYDSCKAVAQYKDTVCGAIKSEMFLFLRKIETFSCERWQSFSIFLRKSR